jgi:hypothetical protein
VKAQTFYEVGELLGLSQTRLNALLDERAWAGVEDLGDGPSLVIGSDTTVITSSVDTSDQAVNGRTLGRWVREFNRLRNEERR